MTEMHTEHVQIQQSGRVAVQAKLLADIVRKMQENEIILYNEETNDRLTVTTPLPDPPLCCNCCRLMNTRFQSAWRKRHCLRSTEDT